MSRAGAMWERGASKLNALMVRERALVLGVLLVGLYLLWMNLLMEPLEAQRLGTRLQIQKIQAQTQALQVQSAVVQARGQADPDREARLHLTSLQQEIARLDAQLQEMTVELISPQDMPQVVEELLSRQKGLRLIKMKNLGAQPLLTRPEGTGEEPGRPNVYRHALRIEFEASYLDTLAYLKALEGLPRGLYWEDLNLDVHRYPKARISLTVNTLSLQKEWIGV